MNGHQLIVILNIGYKSSELFIESMQIVKMTKKCIKNFLIVILYLNILFNCDFINSNNSMIGIEVSFEP